MLGQIKMLSVSESQRELYDSGSALVQLAAEGEYFIIFLSTNFPSKQIFASAERTQTHTQTETLDFPKI